MNQSRRMDRFSAHLDELPRTDHLATQKRERASFAPPHTSCCRTEQVLNSVIQKQSSQGPKASLVKTAEKLTAEYGI
jgi:hypothetical protein